MSAHASDAAAPALAIDHVQIAAPPGAEAEARRFYGTVLGLRERPKPPLLAARGGAWFDCGAHQLHVGIESPFVPARKAHVALRVADVAALEVLMQRLEAHGVRTKRNDEVPGSRRFYADDPWGNRLEFVTDDA